MHISFRPRKYQGLTHVSRLFAVPLQSGSCNSPTVHISAIGWRPSLLKCFHPQLVAWARAATARQASGLDHTSTSNHVLKYYRFVSSASEPDKFKPITCVPIGVYNFFMTTIIYHLCFECCRLTSVPLAPTSPTPPSEPEMICQK